MLKDQWRLIARLERIGDILIICSMFFLAYHLRDSFLPVIDASASRFDSRYQALASIDQYFVVLGIAMPLYSAILSLTGAYRSMRFLSFWQLLKMMILASALVFLCLGFFFYLFKLDLSRSFVGLFCLLSGVALLVERVGVLLLLRFYRVRGRNFRNVLIAGTGQQGRKIYRELSNSPELGLRIVGFVELGAVDTLEPLPMPVVAEPGDFERALKAYAVDEVVFTEVILKLDVIEEMVHIAAEEGVRVSLAADFFSLELLRSEIGYCGSVPLIHYQSSPMDSGALLIKRGIDVAVASLLLVVLAPVFVAVSLFIKLDSAGPIFFRQRRVGLNGRTFTLLKFRSMVQDAEALQGTLAEMNEMTGPVFKVRNDPRVTRIGKPLRRCSIDELPQLMNVLRGDMSLVGPRPPLPTEVSLYERRQRRRLSMRPGLTCIWQVSGRNEIPDFETWAKLDLEYIDNWSLAKDFSLLLKTIPAVFSGSGAR